MKNKGLTVTTDYIEQILLEYGTTEFYVYSIKTNTALGFTNAITVSSHLTDVTSVSYVEEAVTNGFTIAEKITAIKNGVLDNAENGAFRIGYIIPYGTVHAAVESAENTTAEAACIASLTTILSGNGNGRICVALPDENAGIVIGKCLATPYNEDAGFNGVSLSINESSYNFNAEQMLTLQNLGVLFLREEKRQGIYQQRIEAAVTTSFKESANDGLLICRRIVDEVLRRIGFEAEGYVKANETAENVTELQTAVNGIVNDFVAEQSIIRSGTNLKVSDAGNMKFKISGKITPVRSVQQIEVNTILA